VLTLTVLELKWPSRPEMRAFRVAIAAVALMGGGTACLTSGEPLPASATYVRVGGHDSLGNRVEIVWGPDGGDMLTIGREGERDEVWFQGLRLVHRDVFGTVEVSQGYDPLLLQYDRFALTLLPWPLKIAAIARSHGGSSVDTPTFAGDYAVAWWGPRRVRFEATGAPEATPQFPLEPVSAWMGPATNGPVAASIAGRPVRVIVDTATDGVRISRRLAGELGLPEGSWAKAFFLPESVSPIVRLQDVRIAGMRAPIAFARVVDDDAFDMYVGIAMFRGRGVAFSRGAQPAVTSARCSGRVGVAALTDHGVLRLVGPDVPSAPAPGPTPGFHVNDTLFDSTYSGSPIFYFASTLPQKMPVVEVAGPTRRYFGAVACDGPPTITLNYSGRRFGTDVPVCAGPIPDATPPATYRSVVVGLHSLAAKTLLVDLQNNRVCWYN